MRISIIAAVSENGVIGKSGQMPWYIPLDLKHFKQITMGHHILMGRKTYESIGKALPGRTSLILTKDSSFKAQDCFTFNKIDEAINFAKENKEDELFIIGGSQIYEQFVPLAKKIYLTRIHKTIDGDIYFPKLDKNLWKEESKEEHLEVDPPISFMTLLRV